ncbi:MAG: ABC transporter permease [Chloroflexota bacterium]
MLCSALIALPVLAIFVRSSAIESLGAWTGRSMVIQSLWLSLITSSTTLLLAIMLGTPLALYLARSNTRPAGLIDTLIELPMVLPPAVAGIGLLLAFGRRGLLGSILEAVGLTIAFTTAAVVLAQLFVAMPFYIRSARAGFLLLDHQLEEAARSEGATEFQVVRHISVPLALPSLVSGALMCWARAVGEFGATIMFAGSLAGRTQTMPLAIYAALESDLNAALELAALLTVASLLALSVLRYLARRHLSHSAT